MLPVRTACEALGGTVKWNQAAKAVEITSENRNAVVKIKDDYLWVNGENLPLSEPVQMINGRIYLPLREIGEIMGCTVN